MKKLILLGFIFGSISLFGGDEFDDEFGAGFELAPNSSSKL